MSQDVTQPFSIAVFASSDGQTPQWLLENVPIDEPVPGTHELVISPVFDDLPDDYFLIVQVDSADNLDEANETNNIALFAGGWFVAYEPAADRSVLHLHTADPAETLWVTGDAQQLKASLWPATLRYDVQDQIPAGVYADINGDRLVDGADLKALAWGLAFGTPWQNPANRFDTNNDGILTPLDALLIINYLIPYAPTGWRLLDWLPTPQQPYIDVSGDNFFSEQDFYEMLDGLSSGSSAGRGGAWQNSARPLDANADGNVDLADLAAVAGVLAPVAAQEGGYKATGPLAGIAAVHARLRGGADLALPYLLQNPPEIWLFGGSGDDFLVGTPGADRLFGGAGHDTLLGLAGDDWLVGGDGDDLLSGGLGEDKLYGGAGENALDGGPGYDVVDPTGPHEEDRFEGHYVQVFLDMRRIADVIYDERHVVVTLEGPGGLVLRELRSLVATASLTGDTDPTVVFPIPDAYTEYGLSVTVSGGLIGGGSLTFNSSKVNYDQNGVFEAEPFVILSTGHNYGPQGEEPYPGYEPPSVDPPPVIAQNDWWPVGSAKDGACRYCTISGGTLEITDPAEGVLANDYTASQFWPEANLTAQLVDPPRPTAA